MKLRAPLPPAIILGGSANAVSVARALGRAGVRVYALGGPAAAVRWSRHCAEFVDLGDGGDVQARSLEWLARGPRHGVLLPCGDDGLELVARNRDRLEELGYAPIEANDAALLDMLDKRATYRLAHEAGVGAPVVRSPTTAAELEAAAAEVGFPCAFKPALSHLYQQAVGTATKLVVIPDLASLRREFARFQGLGVEMMVTEIIPGSDDRFVSFFGYLDENGETLFRFTKRKLRQYPIHFGLGSYHVTAWNPEVAETAMRFLRHAGVCGLANVEFKRDPRDGQLKLIECNHRFTEVNELVRLAGIDLALFTYARLIGRPIAPPTGFRDGVRMWKPGKDVRALVAYRRAGELDLAAWARSLAHRQRMLLWDWRDPGPSLYNTARVTGVAARRLAAATRPAGGRIAEGNAGG